MSKYIPPECNEFIRSCTSNEVIGGHFQFGLFIGLILGIIITIFYFLRNCKKHK